MKPFIFIVFLVGLFACNRKKGCTDPAATNYDSEAMRDDKSCKYIDFVDIDYPDLFDQYLIPAEIPEDNPTSAQGILLGRMLFYDTRISPNSISCVTCHQQNQSFTEAFNNTITIQGHNVPRNVMPLFNLSWTDDLSWDGRSGSLEPKVLASLNGEATLNSTDEFLVDAIGDIQEYKDLFELLWGENSINLENASKALSQFIRTLNTGNSKFDKYLRNEGGLTSSELSGFSIFMAESQGDCFHCHGDPTNPLWTDNVVHNNGLDAVHTDLGYEYLTGDPNDRGKFRTPSLRNLVFTAPYMHDGRFNTIDEVIMFYSAGLQNSPTVDPLMKNVLSGGNQLNLQEQSDLKAFLLTLTDSTIITDPTYADPF